MLLKQYERLKEREIELGELRQMLGLRNTQYEYYNDFKRTILEPSRKELKAKTDLYFEFDEIKHGRRVGAIRFRIFTKKLIESISDKTPLELAPITLDLPLSSSDTVPSVNYLLLLVPEQHKAKKTVQMALETFEKKQGFDYVKRNILYSNAKADKSYAGFLNNALKDDWGHDWELEQQAVQVKKKVVEIWERQGFPSQKEYDDFMYRKQMQAYGVN